MTKMDVDDNEASTARIIAAALRQCSESGRLISESELKQRFIQQKQVLSADRDADFQSVLAAALQKYDDLQELTADDGALYYYSSQSMTRAYASMLLQMQGDPVRLIAGVVRENSASYPRPVPLNLFTNQPFGFTHDQILDCLNRMAGKNEYADIASTTTSASTVFLYSTLHLEPEHASMLAEWFDVGQFENP